MKVLNKESITNGLWISLTLMLILIIILFLPVETISYQKIEEIVKDEKIEVEVNLKDKENIYCSCIETAREEGGVNIPYNTNAEDLIPNSIPRVGCLVLMKYPKESHVGTILDLRNGIVFLEGNKISCEKDVRTIPYDYKYLTGFWCPQ